MPLAYNYEVLASADEPELVENAQLSAYIVFSIAPEPVIHDSVLF